MKKLTTDEWVEMARETHGDKYDYSLVKYEHSKGPVKIVCPEHGVFEQRPSNHVSMGRGCPQCGKEEARNLNKLKRLSHDSHCSAIHNVNKSVQILEEIKTVRIPVKVMCLNCNNVWTARPKDLKSGQGCPACASASTLKFSRAKETFSQKVREVHGDRIDLNDFEYKGSKNAGIAKCTECGNVWRTTPNRILKGCGCPQCAKTGFLSHKKGYLYVMVDNKEIPTMMKIGCSIDPHDRCESIIKRAKRKGVDISTLCVAKVWEGDTQNIYQIEQELHSRFSDRRYFGKDKVFDGSTEFFHYDGSVFDIIDKSLL